MALFDRQPVAKTYTELLYAFDSPDACCKIRTEQTAVGGFISEAAYRPMAQIYSARREVTAFEVDAITQNHCSVERQPRLGAVPFNELVHRVTVAALGIGRCEAIEDGGLCLIEVRQSQDRFGDLSGAS
jgi:hypothetical protein